MTQTRQAKFSELRQVQTNAGIRNQYRRLLTQIVREISEEVSKAILEQYGKDAPEIVQDATPAEKLAQLMKAQRERFELNADSKASELANWFVNRIAGNVGNRQREAMKAAGLGDFVVRYQTGAIQADVVKSLVVENVNLIKSISSQYLTEVEGLVMRSVQAGRDLNGLAKDLKKRYDITARRAAMIARDQSNKATESISRANNLDAGITKGIWIHIPGRKSSREVHKAWNGQEFDLNKGLYNSDTGMWELPGIPVNCNCSYRPLFDKTLWQKIQKN